MNRIAFMALRCFPRAPYWFYQVWKLGRPSDTHTEQERYDYLRNIVKKVNHASRVEVSGYGVENIPEENGFILFLNHQGLFDMLAIIAICPKPVALVNSFPPFDISTIQKEHVQVHYLKPLSKIQYMDMKTRDIAHLVYDEIQKKLDENIA